MDGSRERRASRTATAILAALLLWVPAANLLWPEPPVVLNPPRLDPAENPFPFFGMGPELRVVSLNESADLATRLLFTSLQGLVNRDRVELYLDTPRVAGNTTEMLAFLASRYGIAHTRLSQDELLSSYLPRAAGIAVYDPSNLASVNVATMVAAQGDAVLASPDLAASLTATFGLQVLFDYRGSDWARLDPVAATERALRELYPGSARTLLSILPPDRWATRDYLVATRTFVFYLPQGALASPSDVATTRRVLDAAPHGAPILGWFDSPTLTEENAFVQMASHAGKAIVGVQDVPNLSVLTAIGRNATRTQVTTATIPSLEDRTYAVLAVPDGDNVDFVAGRMRDLWDGPERGTVPIAWSMNPLLADLAPPLLDSYYDTMSPLDRFVAAPSGAGYLYPDYTGVGDLPSYLETSNRSMRASDLDVVWLLNAFTASEIPYSDGSLSAYVDAIRPDGLVLDYDDQPKSRDAWMQSGSDAVAPVVRSTHFWTTRENFLGKFEAARAAWDPGAHFLWITVYTFRYDLRDALDLVGEMQRRTGDDVVLVTPTQFFRLMREDFVARAAARVRAARGDPIASTLLGSILSSAEARVATAEALRLSGDLDGAARAAYLALEDVRMIAWIEAMLAVGLAVVVLAALAIRFRRPKAGSAVSAIPRARSCLFLIAAVAFYFLAVREAAVQNFWTYPIILVGLLASGLSGRVRRRLEGIYPSRAPVAAAVFLLIAASLAIRTTAAFPLAIVATLVALESVLRREPLPAPDLIVAFALGSALGFAAPFALPVFTALAVLLVGAPATMPSRVPPEERRERVAGRALAGAMAVLPLAALAIPSSYAMSLRLDLQGDLLTWIAGGLLAGSAVAAGRVDRLLSPRTATRSTSASLGLAIALCGAVLLSRGAIAAAVSLAALFASLTVAAIAVVRGYTERGGSSRDVLLPALTLVPLLLLFVRMPPIVYSLTLVRLPEVVEYALYTPVIGIAAAALLLGALAWVRGRRPADVEKDYPPGANGGAGGP